MRQEKLVYYIKADKWNALVVLDKKHYEKKVLDENKPWRNLRNQPYTITCEAVVQSHQEMPKNPGEELNGYFKPATT